MGYVGRYGGGEPNPPVGFWSSGYWGLPSGICTGVTMSTTLNALVMCMYQFPAGASNIDRLGLWITAGGGASSVVRLGAWAVDASGAPSTLLVDAGTIDGNATNLGSVTVNIPRPANGYVLLGACAQGTGTPTVVRIDQGGVASTLAPAGNWGLSQTSPVFRHWLFSGTTGAFSSSPSVGTRQPGTNLTNTAPCVLVRHA